MQVRWFFVTFRNFCTPIWFGWKLKMSTFFHFWYRYIYVTYITYNILYQWNNIDNHYLMSYTWKTYVLTLPMCVTSKNVTKLKGRKNEVVCFFTNFCTEHQLVSIDSQYISWWKNKYFLLPALLVFAVLNTFFVFFNVIAFLKEKNISWYR